MPFYTYHCPANGRTVEVLHSIGHRLKTWGEVCRAADMALGSTPADAGVDKLLSKANPAVFRLKGLDKDAPSTRLEP